MNFGKEYNEINNRLCNIVKETIDIEADIAVKLEVIEAVLHLSCISKLKMQGKVIRNVRYRNYRRTKAEARLTELKGGDRE